MSSGTARFLSIVLAGLMAAPVAPRADILEQILVKVNGEILTKTEFEARQVQAIRQRNQPINDDETLKKVIAELTPQLIVDTIDEMLLVQKGRALGLKLGDDQFAKILDNIKKENKLETEEQFQAALKQEGMTLADLRKAIERNMLISGVQQREIAGRIQTTEEEERQYYEAHQQEFTRPAEVTLREILVAVPADPRGINVGQEEEAKQKIDQVRRRVLAGEAFDKLVAEVSDAPSKANGGLIGPIRTTELAQALREQLVRLKPGEVGEPIRTEKGYLLLKLEQHVPASVMPFAEAREQIADRLFDQRRRAELAKYLKKLRAEAIIEWKNAELKKAYEQRIAAGA